VCYVHQCALSAQSLLSCRKTRHSLRNSEVVWRIPQSMSRCPVKSNADQPYGHAVPLLWQDADNPWSCRARASCLQEESESTQALIRKEAMRCIRQGLPRRRPSGTHGDAASTRVCQGESAEEATFTLGAAARDGRARRGVTGRSGRRLQQMQASVRSTRLEASASIPRTRTSRRHGRPRQSPYSWSHATQASARIRTSPR